MIVQFTNSLLIWLKVEHSSCLASTIQKYCCMTMGYDIHPNGLLRYAHCINKSSRIATKTRIDLIQTYNASKIAHINYALT